MGTTPGSSTRGVGADQTPIGIYLDGLWDRF